MGRHLGPVQIREKRVLIHLRAFRLTREQFHGNVAARITFDRNVERVGRHLDIRRNVTKMMSHAAHHI